MDLLLAACYRFPKDRAAAVAIRTAREFLENNRDVEAVTFVCFDDENYNLYGRFLGEREKGRRGEWAATGGSLCQNILSMKIAVFPGSFDPITTGHVDLVNRALPLFDKIVVAVGVNSQKKTLFSLEQRLSWLNKVFEGKPKVEISHFTGLSAHFCTQTGALYLLRGLRNASDFDYEKTISQLNHIVGDSLETVFLISQPEYSHISSTIVREIIKGGGDASPFVPAEVKIPPIP
jgi:pantetheine-phosphate adenylyltransferase